MRYSERHAKHSKAIKALGLNGTFIGLAYAALETVWPIYIFSFFPNESQVGFVAAIFSLAALSSLLFAYPLFKRFTPKQLLFISIGINAIIFALFAHIQSATMFIILGIVVFVLIGIRVQSFGVLLRHNTTSKKIQRDENYIYLWINIGWILGPLIGGYIANTWAINAVMIFASAALLLSAYSITYSQHEFKKDKKVELQKIRFIDNIKDFFKNKKRVLSYCLSGGLEIWWSIPYIFLPIVMIQKYGFNIGDVGVFLFTLVVPLMIVEYFMQKKEIKNLRKIIGIGYIIAAGLSLIAGVTNNIYIILGAFVISSFGIGLVEPSIESYFFKVTKENESERFYGSFMTAKQVGSFIGKVLVASVLLLFPLQVSILIVGLIVLALGIWSLKGKKWAKKH